MKLLLFLLVAIVASVASSWPTDKWPFSNEPADKEFLKLYKDILQLYVNPYQNGVHEQSQQQQEKPFDPMDHLHDYEYPESVRDLCRMVKEGRGLPWEAPFSVFHPEHRHQMELAFEALYSARSSRTFLQTAQWLRRVKVNPSLWLFALNTAVLHRVDTRGMVLPPHYEVEPHRYVRDRDIRVAYSHKMRHTDGATVHIRPLSGSEESQLSYLSDDPQYNEYELMAHQCRPFWWKPRYGDDHFQRHGELFFYQHHQALGRMRMERRSLRMPDVVPMTLDGPIPVGCHPGLSYRFAGAFPSRPDNARIVDTPDVTKDTFNTYAQRVKTAVDMHSIETPKHQYVHLDNAKGVNLLGNLIEPTKYSLNPRYYGGINTLGHLLIGGISGSHSQHQRNPSVMEHYETSKRDYAFFSFHHYLDDILKKHKGHLEPYTKEDLEFPGVRVGKVQLDRDITTFLEDYEFDLDNAVDYSPVEEMEQASRWQTEGGYHHHQHQQQEKKDDLTLPKLKAVTKRLNHHPVTFLIHIDSQEKKDVTVRVFLAPKYDQHHREMTLDKQGWQMVEIDRFTTTVEAGEQVIERKSTESSVVARHERLHLKELLTKVEDAIQGKSEFKLDKHYYQQEGGYPMHLLFPRGSAEGTAYTLAVMVTDLDKDKSSSDIQPGQFFGVPLCPKSGHKYSDNRSMIFPFDRPIRHLDTFRQIPNMHFMDVNIYHRDQQQQNQIQQEENNFYLSY
uniref:Hexamerin 1 n=1 Tax=Occasjapyx japonicus TaxID=289462 RepID=A0A067XNU9_9HEXA|nr:hexamerin 1 precursor [Occasjapyx japonicus]